MELSFKPPGGKHVRPSLEFLQNAVLFKGEDYWHHDSGTGTLTATENPIDKTGIQKPTRNQLTLSLKEPHGFLLTYWSDSLQPDDLQVTSSSTDYSQTVTVFVGDDWTVPTAFFVSRDLAWRAVEEFCRIGQRPNSLNWVKIADQKWDSG